MHVNNQPNSAFGNILTSTAWAFAFQAFPVLHSFHLIIQIAVSLQVGILLTILEGLHKRQRKSAYEEGKAAKMLR